MNAAWEILQGWLRASEAATLVDLALVAVALALVFIFRRAWFHRQIRRAAEAPVISVGGWGSRGKSGTERKKGALMHALGLENLVKTTGCEAELIHSFPGLKPQEVFLYRAYDRATIWEQAEVTRMAARAGVQVLCWEAMALNPRYVRIIHEDWMRSSIHTITNTFPDHEDHQGPSGADVARSLASFAPRRGTMITTEETMLPLLADQCRRSGSRMISLGIEETAFLPEEVLQRFPYQVHSSNLAVTVALGQELGVPALFTLREVAEHLVPDLGALRIFPRARYRGRTLEFANAMSANERLGCLTSYRRIEYDRTGSVQDPRERLILLVNNRADRIARSRVFAEILVMDLAAADAVVVIGTNLSGFEGYLRHALGRRLKGLELFPRGGGAQEAAQRLEAELRELGLPVEPEELRTRLAALPGAPTGLDPAQEPPPVEAFPTEVQPHVQAELDRYQEARSLLELAAQAATGDARQRSTAATTVRRTLARFYLDRLVLIADPGASGNRVLDEIARLVPPGLLGRILGIQNIKGTGLDFVYRWVSYTDFDLILGRATGSRSWDDLAMALDDARAFPHPGLLESTAMEQLADQALAGPHAQEATVQAAARALQARASRLIRHIRATELRGALAGMTWSARLIRWLERLLDAGDARRRRRDSRRLYRDLMDGVVSHPTAARLAHHLVERQKGGWLRERLARMGRHH